MIQFAISVFAGLALYWYFILRPGRLDFWRFVAKHPDAAYDHFKADNRWKVFEDRLPKNYRNTVPKREWAGPFRITVPKLGDKSVYIFGIRPDYGRSQDDFLDKFARSTARR
ncbi:MAG: hypothetical protein A3G40_02525 [Deltaproteobacteria bacterium RIFCSPLOWO2_12_FULL_57_22]|nr:MAG: hypothetical protein A3G40_02525 [Deltaproteobacteria bacterium RIFCSPLOWO2_12_FULL_57_22]